MSSDVIAALDFDNTKTRLIVIKETGGAESSFITSCVLAHQARMQRSTVLLTFHQLLDHYNNFAIKMAYNIKHQHSKGLIKVISPTEKYLQNLFSEKTENILTDTIQLIEEEVIAFHKKNDSGKVCIYIDGLTHLFDLGFSLKSVNEFARTVTKMADRYNCFTVVSCAVTSDEDDSGVLANLLSHSADSVAQCESLASGWSADVSGHLVVMHPGQRFDPNKQFTMAQVKTTKYHFRLFDRGVKLFAPGMAGL